MQKESHHPEEGISFFARYLSLWVLGCIVLGVFIGKFVPVVPQVLSRFEYAHVSLPIAVLIWLMIYPMMLKVDFSCVRDCFRHPKGLTVTLVSNWLIKPFTMYAIASVFFLFFFRSFITTDLAHEYLAGAIILGAAPCTAMVFVWSHLTKGNATYTLLQVAINDIIILVAFAPIVTILLGISGVTIPYATLLLSVMLFVVIPFTAGYFTRRYVIRTKGSDHFEKSFLPKFSGITEIGLLLTLVIIFSYQGEIILRTPLHIVLIAVPLILQTCIIFAFAYIWARYWRIPHSIAAPAGLIGASNFFELAVAVAISLFGLHSGATLATVVGVLVEVPVMLLLVRIANRTRGWFVEG